ncbi:hypothetical protein ACHQM5_015157 [Ranunculus cassubicifolius]
MEGGSKADSPSIKPINKSVVHRICSGQVILDLPTAVKELVENSLDAGATSIEVLLKDYGEEYFKVIDNGCGISPNNFKVLALKHHTSKLEDFPDLRSLTTFGFRGEALSSLCALGNVTVETRTKDEPMATHMTFDHTGLLVGEKKTARQIGTTVTVAKLFSTLPVRSKEFSRNIRKEYGKLITLLNAYAIIAKGVRLVCTNTTGKNAKSEVVKTQGSSSIKDNIMTVFGTSIFSCLEPLGLCLSESCTVEGFVSKSGNGSGRNLGDRQFYFVNGRPVDMPKISKLVNELYRSANSRQYPIAIMNFTIPTGAYDVNVTPDKRKIFFSDEGSLLKSLREAIEKIYSPSQCSYSANKIEKPKKENGSSEICISPKNLHASFTSEGNINQEQDGKEQNEDMDIPHMMVRKRLRENNLNADTVHKVDENPTRKDFSLKGQAVGKVDASFAYITKQLKSPASSIEKDKNIRSPLLAIRKDVIQHADSSSNLSVVRSTKEHDGIEQSEDGKTRHTMVKMCLRDKDIHEDSYVKVGQNSTKDFSLKSHTGGKVDVSYAYCTKQMKTPTADKDKYAQSPLTSLRKDGLEHVDSAKNSSLVQTPLTRFLSVNKRKHESSCTVLSEMPLLRNEPVRFQLRKTSSEVHAEVSGTHIDADDANEFHATECSGKADLSTEVDEVSHEGTIVDGSHRQENIEDDTKSIMLIDAASDTLLDEVPESISEALSGSDKAIVTFDSPTTPSRGPVLFSELQFSIEELRISRQHLLKLRSNGFKYERKKITRRFAAATLELSQPDNEDRKAKALAAATNELERFFNKDDFRKMQVIGQFNLGFIIGKLDQDLFIIDQHAADEKHNFERLSESTILNQQPLLQPLRLELSPEEEIVAAMHMDIIRKNGFTLIEDANAPPRHRFKLRAIPFSKNITFGPEDVKELIWTLADSQGECAIMSSYKTDTRDSICPPRVRGMLASRACRSSVMIGDSLSRNEMEKILEHLAYLKSPWNCPHGRPTMRHLIDLTTIKKDRDLE